MDEPFNKYRVKHKGLFEYQTDLRLTNCCTSANVITVRASLDYKDIAVLCYDLY